MKKDICDWLREFLRAGPKEVNEIKSAARSAGYTRGDLREAKRICGIRSKNNWDPYDREISAWYWALPEDNE